MKQRRRTPRSSTKTNRRSKPRKYRKSSLNRKTKKKVNVERNIKALGEAADIGSDCADVIFDILGFFY